MNKPQKPQIPKISLAIPLFFIVSPIILLVHIGISWALIVVTILLLIGALTWSNLILFFYIVWLVSWLLWIAIKIIMRRIIANTKGAVESYKTEKTNYQTEKRAYGARKKKGKII